MDDARIVRQDKVTVKVMLGANTFEATAADACSIQLLFDAWLAAQSVNLAPLDKAIDRVEKL